MIIGIDEVGRGCWAGPLVVGAVGLKQNIQGLKDSKLLSRYQRQRLFPLIIEQSYFVGVGWATSKEIDQYGLTKSLSMAMERSISALDEQSYSQIIIDGNYNYFPFNPKARAIIKADNSVPEVSAASIVAKVIRDQYMYNLAKKFPDYGFDKHVGYGTSYHKTQIELHGLLECHRLSFKPMKDL